MIEDLTFDDEAVESAPPGFGGGVEQSGAPAGGAGTRSAGGGASVPSGGQTGVRSGAVQGWSEETAAQKLRDNGWLQQLLDKIWDNYFADVPQVNDVRIEFGRRAKRRLGSISLDPKDRTTSVITMNGLFRDPKVVPEFVVEATVVHELTHYAHGFNSPLEQAQKHPHAGGVMRREFAERGLLELYLQQKRWLKFHWAEVLLREMATSGRRVASGGSVGRGTGRTIKIPKPFWFIGE